MGSETKIGLLVGMCFIVCFAIILAHRGTPEEPSPQGVAAPAATSEQPANRQANQDAETRDRQATRRVDDLRQEPPPRPYQLQPRRYATGPANEPSSETEAADRFRRRSAPLPAPQTLNRLARTGRRAPQQTFEEGFADALANAGRSTDRESTVGPASSDDLGETAQRSTGDFLQAARPLLDAGREMADALAGAGYELSRQAQLEQANRRAEAARVEAERREAAKSEAARAVAARATASRNTATEPSARESLITSPAQPERAPASRGVYRVKSGDNLTRIARRVYQDDSKQVTDAIYDANRSQMNSPDHLIVGREIVLPEIERRRALRQDEARIASGATTTRNTASSRDRSDRETQAAARQLREDLAKLRAVERTPRNRAEPSERAGTTGASRKHVVKAGDTLIRIVRANYGTDEPEVLQRVFAANRDLLASPDAIMIGQALVLPGIETQSAARTYAIAEPGSNPSRSGALREGQRDSATTQRDEDRDAWRWYELKKGDLLTTVAQEQLGTAKRWRELAELNADIFPDPSRIRYGVRIRIPVDRDAPQVALNRRGARR